MVPQWSVEEKGHPTRYFESAGGALAYAYTGLTADRYMNIITPDSEVYTVFKRGLRRRLQIVEDV